MSTDFDRDKVTRADVEAAEMDVDRKIQTLANRRDTVRRFAEAKEMPGWVLEDLEEAVIALYKARAHLRYCKQWCGAE